MCFVFSFPSTPARVSSFVFIITVMENEELVNCDSGDFIILPDQSTLLETLIQNHALLCAEAPQCGLIDTELEINIESFNVASNNLTSKLQALINLSERVEDVEKEKIIIFVDKIQRSWSHTAKKVSDEYAGFFVASRTTYGLPLSPLLSALKTEISEVQMTLTIGEELYDKEYVIKGRMYCNEIANMLKTMEGCDQRVQQYLIIAKVSIHLQELDSVVESFATRTNLMSSSSDPGTGVFSIVSSLLSGELFGWLPVNPEIILIQNTPKKPVFITKNNRRTKVKSLRHLPLFH